MATPGGGSGSWQTVLKQPPRVLVIYSQDHRLYTDLVLKLCAFLQAQCGIEVLLDLLDSASVGMVGPLRWLELQLQKLRDPCDKVLVLCSPGVQAKWRAICGQGRVKLREDVLSPTDEILTPFLNLVLPDLHQAGMMGRYVVAYLDEVCRDQDVPSLFDIAVKYKLMKHLEELYFRILDMEKYQPDQVNHIQGIGPDEYFSCPSGEALRDAIQTFRDFQCQHPDWFEKECVEAEEDVLLEQGVPPVQLQVPPVLECLPVLRDGLPLLVQEVEVKENVSRVQVCSPELNPQPPPLSVAEQTPILRTDARPGPQNPAVVSFRGPPFLLPADDQDQDCLPPGGNSHSSWVDSRGQGVAPSEGGSCQPLREEVLEPQKSQSNKSDLGYMSGVSSQQEPGSEEAPLLALRRLQEKLLLTSLHSSQLEAQVT